MSDRDLALAEAIAAVERARQLAECEDQTAYLDRALLRLHLVQALDESDGDVREILRSAVRHA